MWFNISARDGLSTDRFNFFLLPRTSVLQNALQLAKLFFETLETANAARR
jgi:hypothetical protein